MPSIAFSSGKLIHAPSTSTPVHLSLYRSPVLAGPPRKACGHRVWLFVVATEPDRREALVRWMKRTAYVLLPLSVLLIRYYPTLGRAFDPWSGAPSNGGVAGNKNALGWDCLLLGFFFA